MVGIPSNRCTHKTLLRVCTKLELGTHTFELSAHGVVRVKCCRGFSAHLPNLTYQQQQEALGTLPLGIDC